MPEPNSLPPSLLTLSDAVAMAVREWRTTDATGRRFLADLVRADAALAVKGMEAALTAAEDVS